MSKLPSKIDVPVWGSEGRVLTFESTEDIVSWCDTEVSAWTSTGQPISNHLRAAWSEQTNVFSHIAGQARSTDSTIQAADSPNKERQIAEQIQALRNNFGRISQGTLLTSNHRLFGQIAHLAEQDLDSAAVLLIASRSNGQQALQGIAPPFDALARIGAWLANSDQAKSVQAHLAELSLLKNKFEKDLSELREAVAREVGRSRRLEEEQTQRLNDHKEAWEARLKQCNDEWAELKAIYDEKLSLLAPTDYWSSRAAQYQTYALRYAIAFAVTLAVLVGLFAFYGVGQLKPAAHDASVALTILPVLIPAFAGVWVLRILGRQLSESLLILKDAQERQTLVKTFLALMRDETTGKAVIKDEDRTLILHALFRQSRVTAVDDSPPVNWIESIVSKRT